MTPNSGGPAADVGFDAEALRSQVERVRGVGSVHVGTEPVQIRVTATGSRAPADIVQDVKSLAAAAFGLLLHDDRVTVSGAEQSHAGPPGAPTLAWLNIANESDNARIDVGVAWQGTETTGGAMTRSGAKKSRALAAAQAAAAALQPQLEERGARVVVGAVEVITVSGREWVVVAVEFDDGEQRRPLLGSAVLEADAVAAGAAALLDAMHRVFA